MPKIEISRQLGLVTEMTHLPFSAVPRTQHKWDLVLNYRVQQSHIIIQIIFKVRILNQQDVAGGMLHSFAYSIAFSPWFFLQKYLYFRAVLITQHQFT